MRDIAGITSGSHAEIAASQSAETGEADQIGSISLRATHIAAEIDPPAVGTPSLLGAALAPEPVADCSAGGQGANGIATCQFLGPLIANHITANGDIEVAAMFRIPGLVLAG